MDAGNVRERRKFYRNLLALLILSLSTCAVNTSAQSFPVYVSAGPTIYALRGGNSTVVATLAGANFESLAEEQDEQLNGGEPCRTYSHLSLHI